MVKGSIINRYRRDVFDKVRIIMESGNYNGPTDVKRVLYSKYGLKANRMTVDKYIRMISEGVALEGDKTPKVYSSISDERVLDLVNSKIDELNKIIYTTQDNKEKIMAINAVANMVKTLDSVRNNIYARDAAKKGEDKHVPERNIRFGDVPVAVGVSSPSDVVADAVVDEFDPPGSEEGGGRR